MYQKDFLMSLINWKTTEYNQKVKIYFLYLIIIIFKVAYANLTAIMSQK